MTEVEKLSLEPGSPVKIRPYNSKSINETY